MISKRRQKAYDLAEEVCKAFRTVVTKRVVDQTQEDWNLVLTRLNLWMYSSGKHKYDPPKVPKIRK